MKKNYKIILGVAVLLLVFVVDFSYKKADDKDIVTVTSTSTEEITNKTPEIEKIDEHLSINNTLENVYFCGETYRTKQVVIDDVDVVKRIAELLQKQPIYSEDICKLTNDLKVGGWLPLNEIGLTDVVNNTPLGNDVYSIALKSPTGNFQYIGDFLINIKTNTVQIVFPGYDTSVIKDFGKLK